MIAKICNYSKIAWGGKGGTPKKLFEFFSHRVLKTTSLSQSARPPKKLILNFNYFL